MTDDVQQMILGDEHSDAWWDEQIKKHPGSCNNCGGECGDDCGTHPMGCFFGGFVGGYWTYVPNCPLFHG